MKKTIPCIVMLLVGAVAGQAQEITFKSGTEFTDTFIEASRKNMVSIVEGPESQGLLNFHSEGGGTMLTLSPGQSELSTLANEVEIVFRTEGTITFGVFLRGQVPDGDSYMAFLSASAEKTVMLYLCKTKLTGQQQPANTALVSKHVQNYLPGTWCKLKLSLKDAADKTTFAGELSEAEGSQNFIEISADDTDNPITQPGVIVFRLNGDKAKGGGTVQIKSITVK